MHQTLKICFHAFSQLIDYFPFNINLHERGWPIRLWQNHGYCESSPWSLRKDHVSVDRKSEKVLRSYRYFDSLLNDLINIIADCASIGLTPILVILYTKYWSDTNNSYSLLQVLVWHYLKLFFQQILVWHHLWLFSTPSIGLIPIVVILYTKYWSDTSYSYSPMQVLVWHQL
jgi:hypothetical protein